MNPSVKFKAFISYSHTDKIWANWLHKALETYRIPSQTVISQKMLSNRLHPIFRDREELSAASDLSEAIKDALENSENLIVICSKQSADSQWVNEEIRYFRSLGRAENIFSLLVDEPEYSFPPALTEPDPGDAEGSKNEPLAADARPTGDGKRIAKLKLIAGLIDVRHDELVQRDIRRQQRRLLSIAGAAMAGMLLMTGLAFVAFVAQREAEDQRGIAEVERSRAEEEAAKAIAVNEFLQSTFASANPFTGGDRNITLLEVLRLAEPRIEAGFLGQPLIEAEVKFTVGQTYLSLNEFTRSRELLQESLSLRLKYLQKPHKDIAESYLGLSTVTRELGDYGQAAILANTALEMSELEFGKQSLELVDKLSELTSNYSLNGKYEEAGVVADRALDLLRRYSESELAIARGLFNRADVDAFVFEYASAEPYAREALAIRRREGELPAILIDSLNLMGTITLGLRELEESEGYYTEAIEMATEVFGEVHLSIAIYKENLGNVWFRQGHYEKTITQLNEVLDIRTKIVGETHEAVGRTLSNLGSLNRVMGNLSVAQGFFERALIILEATLGKEHSDIGNVMKSLGYLNAQRGDHSDAIKAFSKSKTIHAKAHGEDSWQAAILDVLIGDSHKALNRKLQAREHYQSALEVFQTELGPDHQRTQKVLGALAEVNN